MININPQETVVIIFKSNYFKRLLHSQNRPIHRTHAEKAQKCAFNKKAVLYDKVIFKSKNHIRGTLGDCCDICYE